jgi:hypothetical protein
VVKKIVGIVCILAVLIGLVWFVINLPALMSASTLYTEEDIKEAKQEGFIEGQKNVTQLEAQIATLKETVKTLQLKNAKLQQTITGVISALLQGNLTTEQKAQLMAETEEEIYDLDKYVNGMNSLIISLKQENILLEQYVTELEEEVTRLNSVVVAMEQVIDGYENMEEFYNVTFRVGDNFAGLLMLPENSTIDEEGLTPPSVEAFLNQYSVFVGWTLEQGSTELIDWETWTPTENTTVWAVITYYYEVNFVYEGEIIDTQVILRGESAGAEEPEDTDRKVFLGWSLNGVDVVDTATHEITQTTTFFAVIETKYLVEIHTSDGELFDTQYVVGGDLVDTDFGEWYSVTNYKIDGVAINIAEYEIYTDTFIVANVSRPTTSIWNGNLQVRSTGDGTGLTAYDLSSVVGDLSQYNGGNVELVVYYSFNSASFTLPSYISSGSSLSPTTGSTLTKSLVVKADIYWGISPGPSEWYTRRGYLHLYVEGTMLDIHGIFEDNFLMSGTTEMPLSANVAITSISVRGALPTGGAMG